MCILCVLSILYCYYIIYYGIKCICGRDGANQTFPLCLHIFQPSLVNQSNMTTSGQIIYYLFIYHQVVVLGLELKDITLCRQALYHLGHTPVLFALVFF